MRENWKAYVALAVLFGGLIVWNTVDPASRELWQGHTERYEREWLSQWRGTVPDAGGDGEQCCRCDERREER